MNGFLNHRIKRDGSGRHALPAVLFILTAFTALLLTAVPGTVSAAMNQTAQEASVTMEVSWGFGDTARGDRYIPVRILLENQQETPFTGTFEILTTASSREAYSYEYPVTVDAAQSLQETCYIPLGVRGDQLFVTLRDKSGAQIVKKRLKLNISSTVSESLVGVLSDSPAKLSYLDQVGIKFGTIKSKTVNLQDNMIPNDARGLDQLDLIVVSDYDYDRLTESQQNCIMRWVEDGGTILFGGGAAFRQNLGRLAPELLEYTNQTPALKPVNLGAEYSQKSPRDSIRELLCADTSLKKGSVLMAGDEYPLLSFVHRKKGRIITAAFSLQDISEFADEHPSFREKLLIQVMGEQKIEELAQMDYYGFSNLYFSAQGLINTGNVDRLPNVIIYTIIIVVYIILIGPGLYLYLKKKSLQRYYIGGVAFSALVFTAVIYIVGAKTRFKEPFFTYATILDASESGAEEQTFVNVRSPFNKPYSVELSPDYVVRPITKSYYYDSFSATEFTGNESYKAALINNAESTQIKIRDTAAFVPKMFLMNKDIGEGASMGIGGTVQFFDGKISGRVVNNFDYRLESAVLILYGRAVMLGDMEPGQEVVLDGKELLNYPLNYTYAFAQAVTGADQYEKADISDEAYMLAQERNRLFTFYLDENMSEYTPQARFAAFSPNRNEKEFLQDKSYITEGMTLVTSSLDVKAEQGGLVYRSALEQVPHVISGNYQARYHSMYTGEPSEPAVIEFSLGSDIEVQILTFEHLSSAFLDNPKYPYLTAFQGKIYFYNYDTGQNDLMEADKNSFEAWELEPYLSPSNTITIKFVNEGTSEYGWDRLLPLIYATGREK